MNPITGLVHPAMSGALMVGGWLDDATRLSDKVQSTGKGVAVAAAIVFIVVAFVWKRTLGAVFAVCIVAGLVLWAVNSTSQLQDKTNTEISGLRAPAVVAPPAPAPA